MFRFVGFFWDPSDAGRAEAARMLVQRLKQSSPQWREALKRLDLGAQILAAPDPRGVHRALPLPDGSGVILGAVFDRDSSSPAALKDLPLSPQDCAQITHSNRRTITQRWWGQFIAVIHDGANVFSLIRSPMSSLPCYFFECDGLRICFSDLWDCSALHLPPFEVNWRYIDAHVLTSGPDCEETALKGIGELRAGECVELSRRGFGLRTFLWNPFDFVDSRNIEDPEEAAYELRRTTQLCVDAWASGHHSILHALSGGLDSTIVLSCLNRTPTNPTVTCINHYSAGSNTDERIYARAAAVRLRRQLIEHRRTPDTPLDDIAELRPRCPKPSFYIGYIENGRTQAAIAANANATAICSGVGGDQLFYLTGAVHSVGDYIRAHGWRKPLLKVAYNAAKLERKSIWTMLRQGIADGVLQRPWFPSSGGPVRRELLHANRKQSDADDGFGLHPWFKDHLDAPNGKRFHAYALAILPFYYNPLGHSSDPDNLFPLLSQPLIELALRIPTHVLTHDGWDRSIARRAFQNDIPTEIAWRRTKGGLEEHARDLFMRNRKLVREMLLDGVLVSRQYLDRAKLEDTLSLSPSSDVASKAEIFEYLCLEAWLRSMVPIARAAAA